MTLYPMRQQTSDWAAAFSDEVLGTEAHTGFSDFAFSDGYHSIGFDRSAAADRFKHGAPILLDRIIAELPDLSEELAAAVQAGDNRFTAAISELSWLIAHRNHAYVSCQITARRRAYTVAQPVFIWMRNIDRRPLRLRRLSLDRPFEECGALDFEKAQEITIAAGDALFVNGFEEIIWFEESGVSLISVGTLPLGAYEAAYDSATGARVGLFSTDLRLSSAEVVLRTFGAAGWAGAGDLARACAAHPVKELRWGALNYAWRSDLPGLAALLADLTADPDPGIRALAGSCLAQLQQEVAA
ncbi:MAG TPA: hypothetical protein VEZ70_10770 [Allosphingosinicella sp.]|nr:hypothetical protein [Allosphingosinicella sp.]